MKKYIAIALVSILLIFVAYEINAEEKAIRNAKVVITGAQVEEITLQYAKIKINIKIMNNESRDIKKLEGEFIIP